jgi:thioredoxin-like negative regulator of GroEL
MAEIVLVDDVSWDREVLRSEIPVLVDNWADWCGPCALMEPELEALAIEQDGRLKVVALNADDSPELSHDVCGAELLPTCVLFVKGEPVARIEGFHRKDEVMWEIESYLPRRPEPAPSAQE